MQAAGGGNGGREVLRHVSCESVTVVFADRHSADEGLWTIGFQNNSLTSSSASTDPSSCSSDGTPTAPRADPCTGTSARQAMLCHVAEPKVLSTLRSVTHRSRWVRKTSTDGSLYSLGAVRSSKR